MTDYETQRQTKVFIVGSTASTLLGPVPPQMTLDIFSVQYGNPTLGTVTGYMLQTGTGGTIYSPNTGTIVDTAVVPNGDTYTSGNGDLAITNISPGYYLAAQADSGSIVGRVTYQYRYGRA